jgi:hypothetical protein
MYKFLKKPYTLAGFEPEIICTVGGRDDQYATPPGLRTDFATATIFAPVFVRLYKMSQSRDGRVSTQPNLSNNFYVNGNMLRSVQLCQNDPFS